jgi:hypothetical protein
MNHKYDPASSAWPRVRDRKTKMVILAIFEDQEKARYVERRLIGEFPGLANKGANRARAARQDRPMIAAKTDRLIYMRELMRKKRAADRATKAKQ